MKLNTFLIIIGLGCFLIGTAFSYTYLNYRYQNNMPPLVSVTMKECSNCKIKQAQQEGYDQGYKEGYNEGVEDAVDQVSEEMDRRSRHVNNSQMVIIN